MTLRIVVSLKARLDLRDIWVESAARWSVRQAESYARGIRSVFNLLAEQPEIARLHREIDPPVRVHPYRSHVVIYRADDEQLDILRVVHGRSDWREAIGD